MNCLPYRNKQICIFGMRGGGKTTFVRNLLAKCFPRHVVFDLLGEYGNFNQFIVTHREGGDALKQEFDTFYNALNLENIDCLVIEEANLVSPSRETPPLSFRNLTNLGRHDDISVLMVARRPVQLNTDAVELADYLVIFALDGKNDIEYLNSLKEGLGDLVRKLRVELHNFVIYRRGGEMTVFDRVKL